MAGLVHVSVQGRVVTTHSVEAAKGANLHLPAVVEVVSAGSESRGVVCGRLGVHGEGSAQLQVGVCARVVRHQRLVGVAGSPAILTGNGKSAASADGILGTWRRW